MIAPIPLELWGLHPFLCYNEKNETSELFLGNEFIRLPWEVLYFSTIIVQIDDQYWIDYWRAVSHGRRILEWHGIVKKDRFFQPGREVNIVFDSEFPSYPQIFLIEEVTNVRVKGSEVFLI